MANRRYLTATMRTGARLLTTLHRAGIPQGPICLLTVPGRMTGQPHTNPVAPVTIDGILYLLEAFPGSDWVKTPAPRGTGHSPGGTGRSGSASPKCPLVNSRQSCANFRARTAREPVSSSATV